MKLLAVSQKVARWKPAVGKVRGKKGGGGRFRYRGFRGDVKPNTHIFAALKIFRKLCMLQSSRNNASSKT